MAKRDIGKSVRDYLTEKLGNPIMPSREKEEIKKLEEEEQRLKQEKGEDYPAKTHIKASWRTYRG